MKHCQLLSFPDFTLPSNDIYGDGTYGSVDNMHSTQAQETEFESPEPHKILGGCGG